MSEYYEQDPFIPDGEEFAVNPEPRCLCLLVLDTSTSMRGQPIAELNSGIETFKNELMVDQLASKRVEVGILSYGPVELVNDFMTADKFQPPTLVANGQTPMGEAIESAIEYVTKRKNAYKVNGIGYYRPWIFLITDGRPTDSIVTATDLVHTGEARKDFLFYAVGVQEADMKTLAKVSVRDPLRLKELRFGELFQWLSNSLSSVSHSTTDDEPPLENPATPKGWARAG